MSLPDISDYDKVLIVEGYSDQEFLKCFLKSLGKTDEVYFQKLNGKPSLRAQLKAFLDDSDLLESKSAIGIVLDADDSAENTVNNLRNYLREIVQVEVSNAGQWFGAEPKFGFYVMPSENEGGELETLVWKAWTSDTEAHGSTVECILGFEKCMKAQGIEAESRFKGLIGALLAFKSDDDPRLGAGARKNVFDFNRSEYEGLRSFLSEM